MADGGTARPRYEAERDHMGSLARRSSPGLMWSVADAKSHLSELLEATGREGPQTITKRGRPIAVVVSIDEWERKKKRKGTLADFFAQAPRLPDDFELPPRDSQMREVDL